MEKIQDKKLIAEYEAAVPLNEYFDFDIQKYVSVVVFDCDEPILREGEKPQYLYYLLSGRAKLFLSHENGRISLINFCDAPCFIGEMELIGAQEQANGVTAVSRCVCYAIKINKCREQILNDIRFLRFLSLFLARKAIGNTGNYSRNQAYPLAVRLAGFILISGHNDLYREKHTEAAEFLGVTYRHLLYVLADFVKKGILKKTAQGYRIVDRAALEQLAQT